MTRALEKVRRRSFQNILGGSFMVESGCVLVTLQGELRFGYNCSS